MQKDVAVTVDHCATKMQLMSDSLLLTGDVRPIPGDQITIISCQEMMSTRVRSLNTLVRDLMVLLNSLSARRSEVCEVLNEMAEVVVSLCMLCHQAVYLLAMNHGSVAPVPGIIDFHKVNRANLEILLSCQRLQKADYASLQPAMLVEVCSHISRNLTSLTDCCRVACEEAGDHYSQEQFHLCVNLLSASATTLIKSIQCFKSSPTAIHHSRFLNFCPPLVSSCISTTNFATEQQYIGESIHMDTLVREEQAELFAACLNVSSAAIQLCHRIRDFVLDRQVSQASIARSADIINKAALALAKTFQRTSYKSNGFTHSPPHSNGVTTTNGPVISAQSGIGRPTKTKHNQWFRL